MIQCINDFKFISLFSLLTIINLFLLNLINKNAQQPYMDEIFHVVQVQHYCNGNYTEVSSSQEFRLNDI